MQLSGGGRGSGRRWVGTSAAGDLRGQGGCEDASRSFCQAAAAPIASTRFSCLHHHAFKTAGTVMRSCKSIIARAQLFYCGKACMRVQVCILRARALARSPPRVVSLCLAIRGVCPQRTSIAGAQAWQPACAALKRYRVRQSHINRADRDSPHWQHSGSRAAALLRWQHAASPCGGIGVANWFHRMSSRPQNGPGDRTALENGHGSGRGRPAGVVA